MTEKKLFLLDAMALIYRAFYALNKNPRINSKGLNTSAILGFANTLYDLLKKEKPTHIGVCFDTMAPTARHIEFEAYKANREAMPDDLANSIPYIKRLVEAFDIPLLFVDGYEADDLIGTLAKKAEKEGYTTFMMTPDKDFGQLVSDNIFIYKPAKFGNKPEIMGVKEVCEKFGIKRPEQVIDMLGLMGDSADNFPGIPGVGEVTARKLLEQFDNVENLLANTDQITNVKLREKVENNKDLAIQSKMLATITLDVPIEFDPDKLCCSQPKEQELRELLDELEFRTFAQRVFTDGSVVKATPPPPETKTVKSKPQSSAPLFDLFNPYVESEQTVGATTLNENYKEVKDIPEFIQSLKQQKAFCFDTETTGTDSLNAELVGIAFCYESGKAWYLPCPESQEKTRGIVEQLKPIFEDENILKVGQNIKYDINVLSRYDVAVKGPFFDTMIAHYILEPERRSNLDTLAKAYLGHDMIPIESLIGKKGPKQKSMRDVPVETVCQYACEDADITWQLRPVLEKMIAEKGAKELLEKIEFPLIEVLARMEQEGVNIDKQMLAEFSQELAVEIHQIEASIYQLAGLNFNIASPKQLGEILFERLKIGENVKKTATKQHSTAEDVLQKLIHKHPIIKLVLDYRSLTKLKSTYVDALPALIDQHDKRLHTSYNQAVTATGRLSSSNPNLQNIPIRTELGRKIRKAFIPRDKEHILLAADYSQIELRIVASISGDEGMINDFKAGHDIHTATAAKIYDVPMEQVDKEMRRKAKSINFGIIYGMSAFGLAEQLGISRSEASDIIKQYFEKYPKIAEYMKQSIESAKEKGYAETLCGRRRYLPDLNGKNGVMRGFAERNAINAPIQGSSADMIKIAMNKIFNAFEQHQIESKMILQVHDELVFDVKSAELEKVKAIVEEEMLMALPLKVPIVVEASIGYNWLEAH